MYTVDILRRLLLVETSWERTHTVACLGLPELAGELWLDVLGRRVAGADGFLVENIDCR